MHFKKIFIFIKIPSKELLFTLLYHFTIQLFLYGVWTRGACDPCMTKNYDIDVSKKDDWA